MEGADSNSKDGMEPDAERGGRAALRKPWRWPAVLWSVDPAGTLLTVHCPTEPEPSVLQLDAAQVEAAMELLAQARGRMQPRPLAWRTEDLMRRWRCWMLAG